MSDTLAGHGRLARRKLASHLLAPEPGVRVFAEAAVHTARGRGRGRDHGTTPVEPCITSRTSDDWRISADYAAWFGRAYVRAGLTVPVELTPEERNTRRWWSHPDFVRFAVEMYETHPFVVKVGDRVCGMYRRGDDAHKAARHMGPRAAVYHLALHYRNLDGAEVQVVRTDRARGATAHLNGSTLRTVRQRVVCGMSEERVY